MHDRLDQLANVFNEAFDDSVVQLLADILVHAGFLLRDQVTNPHALFAARSRIKCDLAALDRPPRLIDVLAQALLDPLALLNVESVE